MFVCARTESSAHGMPKKQNRHKPPQITFHPGELLGLPQGVGGKCIGYPFCQFWMSNVGREALTKSMAGAILKIVQFHEYTHGRVDAHEVP